MVTITNESHQLYATLKQKRMTDKSKPKSKRFADANAHF
jgi:hypothetical protein